jgi:glycerol kinase
MDYFLSLDQGTTSSRALIFDINGKVISQVKKEIAQYFPSSGLVEQDPEEIWATQYEVTLGAISQSNINPSQIRSIGISNQRETTIVWNRLTGKPVYKAIVWQDRRTTQYCQTLKKYEPIVREKTGLILDPYFSASKIRWILDHIQGENIEDLAFGTVDSWLLWKLTKGKVHATDVTNASRTLLFNIHTLKWDEELLEIFKIPSSLLPEVKDTSGLFAKTDATLFSCPIDITALVGDQQAALYGQGCYLKGSAKATYGTGCFLLFNLGDELIHSKRHMLSTIAWKIGNEVKYALEGSVFIAGAAVQWLRDSLGIVNESNEVDLLANSVADTDGVYFVPAFTGLGAPYWDPRARGAILGISRGTCKAHIARATLEAIAFSAEEVLRAMQEDSGFKIKELRVDGGVTLSDFTMQFQSDLIQTKVFLPQNKEITGLGAAKLSAKALGINIEQVGIDKEFEPKQSLIEVEARIKKWNQAIERCKNWQME